MKVFILFFVLSNYSFGSTESSEKGTLDKKLDDLRIPTDKVTPTLSKDKLYIVNTRYSSLRNRHELTLGGANNFTADSHLEMQQATLSYRYHLNEDWSFGLRHVEYYNDLSDAGEKLFNDSKIVPDTDYALSSQEIFASYNTIYGKLRFNKDTVVYFDQYIALGYGEVKLESGEVGMGILDLGFAFWIGTNFSSRVGLKNEFYKQDQLSGSRNIHNAMGYLEIGYLFGEGDRL